MRGIVASYESVAARMNTTAAAAAADCVNGSMEDQEAEEADEVFDIG